MNTLKFELWWNGVQLWLFEILDQPRVDYLNETSECPNELLDLNTKKLHLKIEQRRLENLIQERKVRDDE